MATRAEDIKLGEELSTPRMKEQLEYSIRLAKSELAGLKTVGWNDARQAELEASRATISEAAGTQEGQKAAIPEAGATASKTLSEAKAWKRLLVAWASNALEETPEKLDAFRVGETIGRTPRLMVKWMDKVLPRVAEHTAALVEEGMPADWATKGKTLRDTLSSEKAEHHLEIETLPSTTDEVSLLKARTYKLLKKLNRIGRNLHDGNAALASRYNLDLLNAHGGKGGGGGGGGGGGSGPT